MTSSTDAAQSFKVEDGFRCVCVCICVVSTVQKTVPALLLLSHVRLLAAAANEFETSKPLCGVCLGEVLFYRSFHKECEVI